MGTAYAVLIEAKTMIGIDFPNTIIGCQNWVNSIKRQNSASRNGNSGNQPMLSARGANLYSNGVERLRTLKRYTSNILLSINNTRNTPTLIKLATSPIEPPRVNRTQNTVDNITALTGVFVREFTRAKNPGKQFLRA